VSMAVSAVCHYIASMLAQKQRLERGRQGGREGGRGWYGGGEAVRVHGKFVCFRVRGSRADYTCRPRTQTCDMRARTQPKKDDLNPQPKTLNPKPQVLNFDPQSSTLNLKQLLATPFQRIYPAVVNPCRHQGKYLASRSRLPSSECRV
jgi:hypothetical protein